MLDPRITLLAKQLVHYSVELQKGEKVYIEGYDVDHELINEIVKEAFSVGGFPIVRFFNQKTQREIIKGGSEELFKTMAKYDTFKMFDMDAYIGIRGANNSYELSDVPGKNMQLYSNQILKT